MSSELFVVAASGRREGGFATGWVPVDACTLPTADRPLRMAEFRRLFTDALHGVERPGPGWLRLELDGDDRTRARARDLVARESECCAFFDFALHDGAPGTGGVDLVIDVRVPAERQSVLDGLERQARAGRT